MGVTFILVECGGIGKGNCVGGNCVKEASSGTGHIVWVAGGSVIIAITFLVDNALV